MGEGSIKRAEIYGFMMRTMNNRGEQVRSDLWIYNENYE